VEACYQRSGIPRVRLRAHVISGSATSNGRPIGIENIRLSKTSERPLLIGNMDITGILLAKLDEVSADHDGHFRFGEVPQGKYIVVIDEHRIYVELTVPSSENSTLSIEFYGSVCFTASASPSFAW
jgi:hypothetical protein